MDTTTPTGKLVFSIFDSLAEFERETIKQRQAEGIAIAKAKGVYKGRVK
ncbi:MAG: recombinase family protein, partial [Erysipelotrichaceae bacterium]|nr:recombinase family protein [Erysipelotrichaceae bacterium]